jgi:methoxymalonate biosynthesis acyl carrier protein
MIAVELLPVYDVQSGSGVGERNNFQMNDTKKKIRTFFARFLRVDGLRDEDDIFANGYVNSLFAIQLVAWLEKEFEITITDSDLEIQNFNTINAIEGLIDRKRSSAGLGVSS